MPERRYFQEVELFFKEVLISKILNNALAFFFLMNLDFFMTPAHFDKSITLNLFLFEP